VKLAVISFTGLDGIASWGTKLCEHRFNPCFMDEFESCLTTVESNSAYGGLILTGSGKYFSNGFDTQYIRSNITVTSALQKRVELVMSRILKLPLLTISLINGHCTAAGAVLSLCTDFRIMAEKGLFFTPAVKLGIVYSQGLIEVVKSKVSDPHLLRDILLLSRRYSSEDLLRLSLIQSRVSSIDEGFNEIDRIIQTHTGFVGSSLGEVRARMHKQAIEALESDVNSDMWWSKL
jgi:enoyl-CoA hydratase/carnithine racemase